MGIFSSSWQKKRVPNSHGINMNYKEEVKVKKSEAKVKVDTRQKLWDELEDKGIPFKKNMSKSKLEALLEK